MVGTWIDPYLKIKKNNLSQPALILDKTSGYWSSIVISMKNAPFIFKTLFLMFFLFFIFCFLKIQIKCAFLRQYQTFFLHSKIPPADSPHLDTVFYCLNRTAQQRQHHLARKNNGITMIHLLKHHSQLYHLCYI